MAPPDANPDSNPDLSASPPEAVEVDGISPLPDDIICHIFYLLPFKDLVKTSVLSKQWRLAWISTRNIDVTLRSYRVASLISRALSLCVATKIEKFQVDLYIPTEFHRWLRFATARQVEDVSLVHGGLNFVVPQFMFDCTSLVSLRISNGTFPRDFTINWPSLKKLCLQDFFFDYVILGKDVIMEIMKGCPVLESFTLHSSWLCSRDLRINSRSLKELVIEVDISWSLILSAPNLLSLRLSGGFVSSLKGVSSLVEAELNFNEPTAHHLYVSHDFMSHLLELQHVTKITFGSWCLQVLSTTGVKGWSYLSSRWRNIVVYTTVCKHELQGIAFLLQSSPLLERLTICNPKSNNATLRKEDIPELSNFVEKQFRRSRKDFPCVANQLKRVDIVGFELDDEKSKLLYALAKFLLEEAAESEKTDNPC